MSRLLVGISRLLNKFPSVSLPVVLTVVLLSNMLMTATLLGPGGSLIPPTVEYSGLIFGLAWLAGNAIAAVLLTHRLVTTVIGQIQEMIASAISASVGYK